MGKSLEMRRKKNLDSFNEIDEINWDGKSDDELTELWGASDLGKYTINTPTPQKQAAAKAETQMQPVSKLEFTEITEDLDKEDADMQKKLEEAVLELEGIF